MKPLASPFTREQTLALATDRHLIVSAGAGSGKTRVLVERYVQLLVHGVEPRNVVAITFTKKAAAEMLARAAKILDDRFDKATTPAQLKRLLHVREQLTNARISTIHSFCDQLLRTYPIEARVSPNFTIITESDLAEMRARAVTTTMEEWLEDDERRHDAKDVILTVGHRTVENFLNTLLRNTEQLTQLDELYRHHTDEQLLELRGKFFRDFLANDVDTLLQTLPELFTSVMDGIKKDNKTLPKIKNAEALFAQLLPELRRLVQSVRFDDVARMAELIDEIVSLLLTKASEPSANVRKLVTIPNDVWSAISGAAKRIREFRESLESDDSDERMIRYARILFNMAMYAMHLVNKEKEETASLDFDDLQLKVLDLLHNPDVCASLRKRIRYLMMDEFQDTNAMQYLIAKRLVTALQEETDSENSPNIFIVGDAKQSIYGFRKADVRVFAQAQQDIMRANMKVRTNGGITDVVSNVEYGDVQANENERDGDIHLSSSFRLVPQLCSFVNIVCSAVMPQESHGYEVAYEPIISARKDKTYEGIKSTVEILVAHRFKSQHNSQRAREANQQTITESDLLAGRIVELIEGKSLTVWDEHKEQFRPAEYRDIAILARRSSRFEEMASALRKKGVPFIIHSGRGFFTTQEVTDVISFLKFLHNTNNDIALAATMRSPFFALSDSQLYRIAHTNPTESLWKRFQTWMQETHEQFPNDERIQRCYRILTTILPLAARMPVPQLLRMIFRECGWHGVITYSPRKEQIEANIEKLMQVARAFENRGFKNLFDFVEELTRMQQTSSKEAEAAVLGEGNVLNIMTIHASKGLEFPIVVMFDTNFSNNNNDALQIHEQFGITFTVSGDDDDDEYNKKVKSPIRFLTANSLKDSEHAEDKRLLYVALTRAKEHLLISATQQVNINTEGEFSSSEPKSYFKMIADGIVFQPEFPLLNSSIPLHDTVQRLDGTQVHLRYEVQVRTNNEHTDVVATKQEQQQPLPRALQLETITSTTSGEIFSASQLMLFQQNPDEYIRMYRLGMQSSDDDMLQARAVHAEHDNDDVSGTLAGTLIHNVLSNVANWLHADGTINEQNLKQSIEETFHAQQVAKRAPLIERITNDVRAVVTIPLVRNNTQAVRTMLTEHTLTMPVATDYFTGTMDAIVQLPNGTHEIWDWKTNKLTTKSAAEWLAYYTLQLHSYCFLLAHKFPNQEEYNARLIFTRTGETQTVTLTKQQALQYGNTIASTIRAIKQRCGLLPE